MKSIYLPVCVFLCAAFFGLSSQAIAGESVRPNDQPGAFRVPATDSDYPSCYYFMADASTIDDTSSFYVEKTRGTGLGTLRVRTMDCCIAGDEWQAEVVSFFPRSRSDIGISDGSITEFNGAASLPSFKMGMVYLNYFHGVNMFPASYFVEFCYSSERPDGLDELIIVQGEWPGPRPRSER